MATGSVTGSTQGSASTLDVASIVSDLMKVERRPVDAISSKISGFDVRISSLGVLKSKASALESALSALADPTQFGSRSVSSSNTELVTATATSSASISDIELKVVSTAQASRLAVSGFSSETSAVGGGTLTIQSGSYSTSGGVTSFTPGTTTAITVPANATLAQLRDLINASDAQAKANIVQSGNTYSLVMSGTKTGLGNALRISVANTSNLPSDGPGLTKLAYSEVSGESSEASQVQAARNSVAYVDGLRVERDSNTIDGVVPGVTFQLRKPTNVADVNSAPSSVLSVSGNDSQVRGLFDSVVSAYNDLRQAYATVTKADSDSSKRGALSADSMVETLMSQARSTLVTSGMSYTTSNGAGGTITKTVTFAKFGVELQRDGSLKLNDARFKTALNDGTADALKSGMTIAAQTFLKGALAPGGLLDIKESNFKTSQKLLEDQKLRLESQLLTKQERYTLQFSALDAALFKLNNINDALKQALDALTASQQK